VTKNRRIPSNDIIVRSPDGFVDQRMIKTIHLRRVGEEFLVYAAYKPSGLKRAALIHRPKKFRCHYAAVAYADVLLIDNHLQDGFLSEQLTA